MIESHTAGGAPWYVHSREDEYLYVVGGALTVSCGREEFRAELGTRPVRYTGVPYLVETGAIAP